MAESPPSDAVTHAGCHVAVLGNDDLARNVVPQALATGNYPVIRFERVAELVRVLRGGTSFELVVASLGGLSDDAVTDVRVLRHAGGGFMPLLLLADVQRSEEFTIFDTDASIHWVPMPCDRSEVLKRVVTAVADARSRKAWSFGHYRFFPLLQVVSINGRPVCLRVNEFELGLFLFRNKERTQSKTVLMEAVWGHSSRDARTLGFLVNRLRCHLELDGRNGFVLCPVRLHGYRLFEIAR